MPAPHLLIQRFEFPDDFAVVIGFTPPSQSDQNSSTDVFHGPEVNGQEENANDKVDDETASQECSPKNVDEESRALRKMSALAPI